MCTTTPLRYEHIFRDADVDRYNAVEMTRTRDAFRTAQDSDPQRAVDTSKTYETLLKHAILTMHQRSHRTSLEHQPSFEWTFDGKHHASACWYFEWMSILTARYRYQRSVADAHMTKKDFTNAKQSYTAASELISHAQEVLASWVWKSPQMPFWCQSAWWQAQEAEAHAFRALAILSHCEHIEDATTQQLYGAACKVEEYATSAACLWPTEASLRTIEVARVKRAWNKAHLLWEEGQYGAAIGLAKAWSNVKYERVDGVSEPTWDAIIHDWTHENNAVHYQKITTPTSI